MPLPPPTDAIRRLVSTPGYPCIMATSVLQRDQFDYGTYRALGADASADALADDLAAFARDPEPDRGFRSFLAAFEGPPPPDEQAFETALWRTLQDLHARDDEPWDASVSSDPAEATFSFSFAGRAFYVIGLHPHASRPARRCDRPALVFNLHDQFERLRRQDRYSKIRSHIRARDRAYAGSVNPMMSDFGKTSEARQYAGREVDESWRCPFHAGS